MVLSLNLNQGLEGKLNFETVDANVDASDQTAIFNAISYTMNKYFSQ